MSDNLDTLRKTAEAATPGPWDLYSTQDYEVFCAANFTDSNYDPPAVTYGSDRSEDAEFIATFNPETALALLSRLEQAEQAVARVREVATAMANHSLPESPRGGAWETANGAQMFAKDILETLGGDSNADV